MSDNQQKKQVIPVPAITPELLAKNNEWQKEMLQQMDFPTSETATMARHRVIVRNALHTLEVLLDESSDPELTEEKRAEFSAITNRLRETAAASLLELGEFEQASELFIDQRQKDEAMALFHAMNIPDDANCDCPDFFTERDLSGREHQFDHRFRERTIFSPKHGRPMAVVKCNLCQFRNIQELPDSLRVGQEIRAAAAFGANRRTN